MKYSTPKGTFDILPAYCLREEGWKASEKWFYLEQVMRKLCRDYGYHEIRTPLFEHTDLFLRSIGDTSDIIFKEMYQFQDKGGRDLCLRPEGTAAVMRAFVEKHLEHFRSFHKFYYIGPFFRYDRPQAGRFRQFHQFGIEAIGNAEPEQDVEVIDMLFELYKRLGIKDSKVLINSVGTFQEREAYKASLKEYLLPLSGSLSEDSKKRLEQNPLRILDSKDAHDQKIVANAPGLVNFLGEETLAHFEQVKTLLKKLHIPYEVMPTLVRGLDYYNKTVFEITSGVLGAQNTIGAGGRFDGLLHSLGGADLPAMGFATGIERILQTMEGQNCFFPQTSAPFVYFIPMGEPSKELCLSLLYELRHSLVPSEMQVKSVKIQKSLQQAVELGAAYAVIIGENELSSNMVELKELKTKKILSIPLDQLTEKFKHFWAQQMENREVTYV